MSDGKCQCCGFTENLLCETHAQQLTDDATMELSNRAEQAERELAESRAEVERLRTENTALTQERDCLRSDRDNIAVEEHSAQAEVATLRIDVDALNRTCCEGQEREKALAAEVERLKASNNRLADGLIEEKRASSSLERGARVPENWDEAFRLLRDESEEEDEPKNEPIGKCPRCGVPVYIEGGFCGVCGK